MNGLKVKVKIKQTLWSKVLWKLCIALGTMRIMSLESAVRIVNFTLRNGAFQFKVSNKNKVLDNKWRKLKNIQIELG